MKIGPDPCLNGVSAAVGLEALEIEAQPLHPTPEMGIIDVRSVGVKRIDHLEEAPLAASRLGRGVQGWGARVLAGDREVPKDEAAGVFAKPLPVGSAVRAAEVGVDDDPLLPLTANVVVRPNRGDRGTAEIGHEARRGRRR